MKLPIIPVDKANHFIWGAVIFVGLSAIMAAHWAFAITAVIAAAKELVWDKLLGRGTPDPCDFGWTLFGTVPPVIFHILSSC